MLRKNQLRDGRRIAAVCGNDKSRSDRHTGRGSLSVDYTWNYPDGLCGGSLAYSMHAPLILTMTKYEAKAVEYATGAGIKSGVVLGGTGLISDAAVRAVFAMTAEDVIQ